MLEQGLRSHGIEAVRCNEPWSASTQERVAALHRPVLAAKLVLRLLRSWIRLVRAARRTGPVDVVLVGYLGVLDVHLARWCWPRAMLVLDHLAPVGGTVSDRAGGRLAGTVGRLLDRWATRRADLVVVDTDEHAGAITQARVVVVPVGAPDEWFQVSSAPSDGPLRVVFFGLHTPLQGTPTIGRALRLALDAGADLRVTMIGSGQDLGRCRAELTGRSEVTWAAWVASEDLPAMVAGQHLCLGIFGTTAKARRVVPNKVFQGAAAGCALVTSDTPPQRRALGDGAVYVRPGSAEELADQLERLAGDRSRVAELRERMRAVADREFRPAAVVAPLLPYLGGAPDRS